MSAHVFAVVNDDAITDTIMLDPADAPIFAFLGELVDLDGMSPQPGIGWSRDADGWHAPVVPDPEPVDPEPEPEPEPS